MGSKRSWTDDQLRVAVVEAYSYRDVVNRLGLSPTSAGNWETVKKYIEILNLDVSHFTHGRNSDTSAAVAANTWADSDVLCENSKASRGMAKSRLVKERKWQCENPDCGLETWCGVRIALELEHINGDPRDHRRENLLLLCPNCHSLTSTWRGRKNKKEYFCTCGSLKWKNSETCRSCVVRPTKIVWPSDEELVFMVETSNFSAVGRTLGVSDNAVRKRIKNMAR